MKFSIIIPALNEEKRIGKAIGSLELQTISREDFEIIVVDNNSNDRTMAVARSAGADIVLKEKKLGTNIARQRGFEISRGRIIAFLDADCEAPPNWLQRIEKEFQSNEIVAISGPYDYGFRGLKKNADFLYTHFLMPFFLKSLFFFFRKTASFIIGGNFAVRREALQKIGGLPPVQFYGDDTAIAMALSREAGQVRFDPDFRVKSSPRRFERRGFLPLAFIYAYYYLKTYLRS